MIGKILAIVALVTLPLSLSLWHKSHRNPEQYRFDVTVYKSLRVYLKDGVCGLRLLNLPTRTAGKSEFRAALDYDATPERRHLYLGSTRNGPYRITWLVFPLWLSTGVLALVGSLPIIRGPARQLWRRFRNCCEECGYNLYGNRSGRCPECGTYVRRSLRQRTSRRPKRQRPPHTFVKRQRP